jgi:hypothetical protein
MRSCCRRNVRSRSMPRSPNQKPRRCCFVGQPSLALARSAPGPSPRARRRSSLPSVRCCGTRRIRPSGGRLRQRAGSRGAILPDKTASRSRWQKASTCAPNCAETRSTCLVGTGTTDVCWRSAIRRGDYPEARCAGSRRCRHQRRKLSGGGVTSRRRKSAWKDHWPPRAAMRHRRKGAAPRARSKAAISGDLAMQSGQLLVSTSIAGQTLPLVYAGNHVAPGSFLR